MRFMAVDNLDLGVAHLTVVDTIGRGGFSVVYKAVDTKLNRPVAVKVLTAVADRSDLDRFDQECQIHGPLSTHPNIVTIHDAGLTPSGSPFLVMEYLDNGSLTDYLDANGPVPWHQAVAWMGPICDAVDTAHRMGVLHRDIKPANILVSPDGPKLADFGIACVTDATSPQFAVSWLHAPPEAELNRRDERSDVYSLASTLFNLIAGHAPYWRDGDESVAALLTRMATEPVPHLHPSLAPPWVDRLLQRALAKDPAVRPATAAELRAALVAGPGGAGVGSDGAATPGLGVSNEAAPPMDALPTEVLPVAAPSTDPRVPTVAPSTDPRALADSAPAQIGADHYRAPGPSRRSKKLPVAAAVVALITIALFLSPALASLQPQRDAGTANTGGATTQESSTTTVDESSTSESSTTTRNDVATTTEGVEGTEPSNTTSETTEDTSETTETTTETTEPTTETTEDTGETTETTEEPTPDPTVPPVDGMPADEAIAVLIEEGFTDVSTVDRASDEVPEGLVIGTDPPAGSVVDPATTITVEVSTGIETTMPDVVGLEPGAATDILQALGLEVIEAEVEVESGAPETGLVVSTNPGAGEVVPNDLTVTIVVAVEGDEPPGPPIVDLERSTTTIPPTTRRLTGP